MIRTVAGGNSNEQRISFHEVKEWTQPRLVLIVVFSVTTAMLSALGEQPILLSSFFYALLSSALAAVAASIIGQALLLFEPQKGFRNAAVDSEPESHVIENPDATTNLVFGLLMLAFAVGVASMKVSVASAAVAGLGAILFAGLYVRSRRRDGRMIFLGISILAGLPVAFGWFAGSGEWSTLPWIMAAVLIVWTFLFRLTGSLSEANYRYNAGTLTPIYGPILARKQIVWFSLLLVVLTLLPLPLNRYSPMYFLTALISGAWFIQQSLRLFRLGTRLVARQMVEFSSLYIGLLLFLMLFETI